LFVEQIESFSIDELRDCNVSWSGIKTLESFHAKLDNFVVPIRSGDYTKKLSAEMEGKCVKIRMKVVDSRNCVGPQAEKTVLMLSTANVC